MATVQGRYVPLEPISGNYLKDQRFFVRFAMVMVAVILFGFFQWEARGMADVRNVPLWVHLHGGLMVSWLGLFVAQNLLAQRGTMDLHRKLGWATTVVVAAILVTGIYTGFKAVEFHRIPPFFGKAQFLALTTLEVGMFALLVAVGVAMRRRMEWHRRLMMGATIVILEPALGRLLPMPLLGSWAEWTIMLIQLGFVAVIARHDLVRRGEVHPATLSLGAAVVAMHCAMALLAAFPPFVALAEAVAGSA